MTESQRDQIVYAIQAFNDVVIGITLVLAAFAGVLVAVAGARFLLDAISGDEGDDDDDEGYDGYYDNYTYERYLADQAEYGQDPMTREDFDESMRDAA